MDSKHPSRPLTGVGGRGGGSHMIAIPPCLAYLFISDSAVGVEGFRRGFYVVVDRFAAPSGVSD